jgi:uncharacterized protein YjcR
VELKDVILSTLSEISEDIQRNVEESTKKVEPKRVPQQEIIKKVELTERRNKEKSPIKEEEIDRSWIEEEYLFLENLRERLLVLFEGFQSPNNSSVESKIDLTLNFLEYLLALLDERITKLKKL